MRDQATFHASFAGDVSVTIKIDYALLQKLPRGANWLEAQWQGKAGPQIIPQYVVWMHTVLSEVAKRVNQKILYVYPPRVRGGPAQVFIYHPDGTYEEA